MRTKQEIEHWVYSYNRYMVHKSYYNDVRECLLTFSNEEEEDDDAQKWANVTCTLENYEIIESQNLTEEEECEIEFFLKNLQQEFRDGYASYIDKKNTEDWLNRNL